MITFITLKNGRFEENKESNLKELTPTHVEANGWVCNIRENGVIVCEAAKDYSDGRHSIMYKILPSGLAKLSLKVPDERIQIKRKTFVLQKGEKVVLNGVIGLSGGYIDERYAFFWNVDFARKNMAKRQGLR